MTKKYKNIHLKQIKKRERFSCYHITFFAFIMHQNKISDELSIDLLRNNFNSRSFLMFLRHENERYREISTSQHNRQYPTKYCTFDNSRGFDRIKRCQPINSVISSQMISKEGRTITDDISKQLLNDNLSIVRRHWRRSRMIFSNKINDTQLDLSLQTKISLKKTMSECQKSLFSWMSKNRLR